MVLDYSCLHDVYSSRTGGYQIRIIMREQSFGEGYCYCCNRCREIQGKYHLRPIADKIKNLSLEREVSLFDGYGATCEIRHRRNLDVSFRLYQWPEALINELVKHIRNFIWSGDSKHMKLIMVSWMKICRPLSEGGPGLRSLKAINKASILSLT
ncbi:hypothetical protein D0Y65_036242 [Glycine soja]|uniref:Uncharacterized protein n=1 Tax=Glycine soja TaxID=3848 RepID=A0A445HDK6_GLYSO|nr:hypothetical protein D0Y65_036242 [Glycine soja]